MNAFHALVASYVLSDDYSEVPECMKTLKMSEIIEMCKAGMVACESKEQVARVFYLLSRGRPRKEYDDVFIIQARTICPIKWYEKIIVQFGLQARVTQMSTMESLDNYLKNAPGVLDPVELSKRHDIAELFIKMQTNVGEITFPYPVDGQILSETLKSIYKK